MYWNTSIIICVYTIHRDISFILKKIGTRYYRYTCLRVWKAISESNAVEKRIRRVCARINGSCLDYSGRKEVDFRHDDSP